MSDQDLTHGTTDAPLGEDDSLTLDPSFSFDSPEQVEPTPSVEPKEPDPTRVLKPVMSGGDASHPEEAPAEKPSSQVASVDTPSAQEASAHAASLEEDALADGSSASAPAPEEPSPLEAVQESHHAHEEQSTEHADPAETMWAAVRDQGRVLTGEEVDLPSEVTDEEDVVGVPSPVETSQIEPVSLGAHTTTIPVMTGEVPVLETHDPTPTPVDVLAHRTDTAADTDTDPTPPSALESTAVQRRSFITAQAIEPVDTPPEASWRPREESVEPAFVPATPQSLDDALFEGSTLHPEVPSRAKAHWVSLIGYLLFIPVMWFLLADAGARLTLSDEAVITTGVWSPPALGELFGGVLVGVVLLLLARMSSLGAWVSGILLGIAGLPWLLVPGITAEQALSTLRALTDWNVFGANLAHHLQASGYSGRLFLLGLGCIGLGIISHAVRRIGRKEEALRAEVEKVNPAGAHFTSRQRRKAAKAAGQR